MKVVVTGGAGYIGSHVCKELVKQGNEVIVYDNLSTGRRDLVKWGDFVYGDIRDTQSFRKCLKKYQPDGIIHFAAFIEAGESVINPGKYFANNAMGALSILEAMRDEGINNIIVSSTCAVYGQPENVPIDEKAALKPVNPYGASKLFVERMLKDFNLAHGINWTALRYFNAAGNDPDGETGEMHSPETHLIPRIMMAAKGKIDKLEVYGNDYDTPDGTCIRDYIHVCDLARAHILALEKLISDGQSLAINLGAGAGYSIMEIIKAFELISGNRVPFVQRTRRPGDPSMLIANNKLAKEYLQWEVCDSSLENIINSVLFFDSVHFK